MGEFAKDEAGNIYCDGKWIGKQVNPRMEIMYATDDGNLGYHGSVIDLLRELSGKPQDGEQERVVI